MAQSESEYAPDNESYVSQVTEEEILPVLRAQPDALDVSLAGSAGTRDLSLRRVSGVCEKSPVTHSTASGCWLSCFLDRASEIQNLPGFDQKTTCLPRRMIASHWGFAQRVSAGPPR